MLEVSRSHKSESSFLSFVDEPACRNLLPGKMSSGGPAAETLPGFEPQLRVVDHNKCFLTRDDCGIEFVEPGLGHR
jgi:hypothetical protein